MPPRLLIIETSYRVGRVGLAEGESLLGERVLDEARRHARELVPAVRDLLAERGWKARELDGVIVSRGPGSYTGLRVGLMSAKTLAYAAGCALIAVETFHALARQVPPAAATVDVIADAQKDKIYVQRFSHAAPATPLTIQPYETWRAGLSDGQWVTGPGLELYAARLAAAVRTPAPAAWFPMAESLLRVGLERYARGERDDLFAVEPLYLRASSAEEQWKGERPA